jgi:hypothetical protein
MPDGQAEIPASDALNGHCSKTAPFCDRGHVQPGG